MSLLSTSQCPELFLNLGYILVPKKKEEQTNQIWQALEGNITPKNIIKIIQCWFVDRKTRDLGHVTVCHEAKDT